MFISEHLFYGDKKYRKHDSAKFFQNFLDFCQILFLKIIKNLTHNLIMGFYSCRSSFEFST